MSSDNMTVAALGRPFTLGMLYDARHDKPIPGFTLWDKTTLQRNTVETSQPSCKCQITASDSVESKSTLLDVDASLKASFLGGLIEVGGSAKYLSDQKTFNNQSRVTFQYKATTNFKQLTLISLRTMYTQQTDVIRKGLATHVVTGIQYGANAFFVFDSERLDSSSTQDIQDSMVAVIKRIPSFNTEGQIDIKLTCEEKDLTNKFSCKFYGDFILENIPTTFEEAVKTYVELPKLLGENGEHAAPVKVWLMPLKNLDFRTAQLKSDIIVTEISVELVKKAEDALEGVRQIEMRCNDYLADTVLENFPQIRKTLKSFQKVCNYYTSALQQDVKKTLLSIRAGTEDESSFGKLFEERDNSPFSQEKLSKWMDHKEREITVIKSCVKMMEGTNTTIVPNQSELDREVLDPGVENTLCFVFPSLESADPCLDAMTNYLDCPESESTNEDHWYFSDEVLIKIREKAATFYDIVKTLKNSSNVRFLATATANNKYEEATIYHYKDHTLVTDDFSPEEGKPITDYFSKPDVPPVETITDRSILIQYACNLSLDPDTASNWLTLSEENKKVTCGEWQTYPDLLERFDQRPQVLCAEGLTGRHYWEIEWSKCSKNNVGVAVTYEGIARKGNNSDSGLGCNNMSWYFGEKCGLSAWHNGWVWGGSVPSTGCKKVGVYLDWPAGTLSFYDVLCNTLSHLYTFHTQFTEPVYPGFWVFHFNNYVALCPLE